MFLICCWLFPTYESPTIGAIWCPALPLAVGSNPAKRAEALARVEVKVEQRSERSSFAAVASATVAPGQSLPAAGVPSDADADAVDVGLPLLKHSMYMQILVFSNTGGIQTRPHQ